MKNNDAVLIQRVLDGDDTAFSVLVKKYQRSVHALAWRKIGDFHIAEDITQDTFLKAYQRLSTLKKPQRFSSWLYVIAANHCSTWLRKKRLWTQSLEETNSAQLEKATYSGYVIEENERTTEETQREIVKKLLAKLQESERTVITLHYLGGMNYKEISEFLGVSVAAIKNRLYRARNRLKEEEPMIREALGNFQITPSLTENIMREVSRMEPIAPSGGKPLVPWTIGVSTLVVVLLTLGLGSQYLSRFQKPYSFDAASEMTVELIEAPVVLNLESKPDIRTELGNANALKNSDGLNQQPAPSEDMAKVTAAPVDEAEEITVTDKAERHITLSTDATTESGERLAQGTFIFSKTDTILTSTSAATEGTISQADPSPMYMLSSYFIHHPVDLFRFPLVVGDSWTQKGAWDSQAEITLEGYEQMEVSTGTFPECLKHKTVFTDAEAESDLQSAHVNGTRYLWFAKGVGLVKMRYEHSNGATTEAELLKYNTPANTIEYLPVQIGNTWTYKWQNDYREEAVIERFHITENLGKPMAFKAAKYEVKINADNKRVAHVNCVLTPKVGSGETIQLSMDNFGTEGLPFGYATYVRGLTVRDATGKTLPIEELDRVRWTIGTIEEFKDTSPITLSYRVLLKHDEREWPPGPDEAPYAKEDCVFWTGRALFVMSEMDNIKVQFNVPENWHVSTPWNRIGNKKHQFAVTDQKDLIESFLLLGTHAERIAKSDEAEVVLAIGERFKAAADEIQETIEAFLKAYTTVFAGTPKGRMLFVVNPYNRKGSMDGGVFGRSISVLMGGTPNENNGHFWMPFVGHEIFHIWNGQAINFRGQEYWFSEGFTEYYSRVVSTRLGFTSEDSFLENLERACELYLSKQGAFSMRDAGKNKSANSDLVYQGGSLVAATLDVQIRKLTQNQKSLDDVMKQVYQEFGLTGTTYTMDDIIRIVSQITGENFKPFFHNYVSGTKKLPLAEYLSDAGIDVQIEFDEVLPDLNYVLQQMLHIKSLTQIGVGLIIHRSQSEGYQDEDNLIGINGILVKTFNDIRKVAKDWKIGDKVELTLERKGEKITLPIKLGGTSDKPPMVFSGVNVTITKKENSTNAQRAILAAILGYSP